MVTKTTSSRTHPIAFCQIILSQNNLFMHEPHKHFDSQRYLNFPNVLQGGNDTRVYDIQIHGFDREHAVLSQFSIQSIGLLSQLDIHQPSYQMKPGLPTIAYQCPPKTNIERRGLEDCCNVCFSTLNNVVQSRILKCKGRLPKPRILPEPRISSIAD